MTLAVTVAQGASNNVTFRNRIINGACVIDQRNAGASVTIPAGGAYTLDRWQAQASQASKYTVQQASTAPTGFVSSAKLTSSSAYSLAAGDYFQFQQSIEGFNAADLNWGATAASAGQTAKPITLSFWINGSVTGTYGLFFVNNAANRIYSTTYTINSANTWEQKTITLVGDTSGTWETTTSTSIRVAWILGYGSTYTGATANTWAALSNNYAVNGCVNFLGTNGATLYITGVQLEAGTTASPFEYRQYGTELALCQRYYQQVTNGSVSFTGASLALFSFNPYVSMRTVPTSSLSGSNLYTWYASGANQQVTSVGSIYGSTATFGGITYALNLSSGTTGGQSGAMYQNTSASTSYLAFSAEL